MILLRLTLQTVGNQTVTATDTGAGTVTATTAAISVSAPPSVASLVVNDGAAQRSRVTTITVTFNTTVDTALLATAFTLARTSGGAVGAVSVSTATVGGQTVATLTFSGANTESGSLADGWWTLAIDRTKVVSTVNGLQMAANYTSSNIGRLFGDANGDGVVDITDYNAFRTTLALSVGQPGYDPGLDWNGDGVVDITDRNAFRSRLGTGLP